MEADRFDRLSRSLATTPSRRGILGLVAGSVLGGLVGLGQATTQAKKGKGKGSKKKGKGKGPGTCNGQEKATICHKGQTITVSECAPQP